MEDRKVFKIENNKEIEIEFEDLKPGMLFKLYEPDGEKVLDENNQEIFYCKSNPINYGNTVGVRI